MEEKKYEEMKEEFKVKSEDLLRKIKDVIHEGNVRRIIIKNDQGKSIMEFPLTVGVVGAVLLPVFAAVGAIAAMAADYTIEVYHTEEKQPDKPDEK
ncbi:MAG: DUF4342 domain-containing protein [Bacteroidetes bacterium]|nr:DUF4342 domain-containing protein [Bacteroidota bacterium]